MWYVHLGSFISLDLFQRFRHSTPLDLFLFFLPWCGTPVTQLLINRKSVTPPPTPCHPPRFRFPLLQEAQALVDNPSFVLAGENPLPSRSDTPDGADYRDQHPHLGRHGAWQQSSVVQGLRGSACLSVVQELQANAPSCWPRDRYLRCYCSMAVGSSLL